MTESLNDWADHSGDWFVGLMDQALHAHKPEKAVEAFLDTRRKQHLPSLITGLSALESRIELEQEEPKEGKRGDTIAHLSKFKTMFEKRIHELERSGS